MFFFAFLGDDDGAVGEELEGAAGGEFIDAADLGDGGDGTVCGMTNEVMMNAEVGLALNGFDSWAFVRIINQAVWGDLPAIAFRYQAIAREKAAIATPTAVRLLHLIIRVQNASAASKPC